MSQSESYVSPYDSFVHVSWRRALLDRGLGPPGVNVPARLGPPVSLCQCVLVSPNESE